MKTTRRGFMATLAGGLAVSFVGAGQFSVKTIKPCSFISSNTAYLITEDGCLLVRPDHLEKAMLDNVMRRVIPPPVLSK